MKLFLQQNKFYIIGKFLDYEGKILLIKAFFYLKFKNLFIMKKKIKIKYLKKFLCHKSKLLCYHRRLFYLGKTLHI